MPEKDKKSRAGTTSTASTSTTTSITTSECTIFPKQSAQITVPKRHAPTLSSFISTDIRLKHHKKSPLSFVHQKTSLTTHPTTSPIFSTTFTTNTPPNTKISTTSVQSTSTTLIHNISTTIINTTTPTDGIATTTASRTQIPALMELNISLPPRLLTPSASLAIPLSSSTPPSLPHIFPYVAGAPAIRTLGDSPARPTAATQGSHHHLAFLKTTTQFNTKYSKRQK